MPASFVATARTRKLVETVVFNMELRVWTEGIERVVCGITDVTTGRDVIMALARTVGRTGRYWLVETCHGHQRRLPASERLLARFSESIGRVRLSLHGSSGHPAHDTTILQVQPQSGLTRRNGFVDSRKVAPLNKSRSVGCCHSLTAADNLDPPLFGGPRSRSQSSLMKAADASKTFARWRTQLSGLDSLMMKDGSNVTDASLSDKSLKNGEISVSRHSHGLIGTSGVEPVDTSSMPPGEQNMQRRQLSARFDRPRLSVTSVSSCSSGEFIPTAEHPLSACDHDSLTKDGCTRSCSELRSMSREQVLRLLSRQQDEISRRQEELSSLSSEVTLTEQTLESLTHNEQSLNVRLSELEEMERRVNEELEELELVSWHDKLDMETNRCTQLEADVETVTSRITQSEMEIDKWQQRVDDVSVKSETLKANNQWMEADKVQLKEQLDNLEQKLAASRRLNHDRRSALRQVEKTIENDAALIQTRLDEQLRLQRYLETSQNAASQFKRSLSLSNETRAKNKVHSQSSSSPRVAVGDSGRTVDIAFSCQL